MGLESLTRTVKVLAKLLAVYIVCLLLSVPQTAAAADDAGDIEYADPVSNSENYSAVLYNNTNGLPTSEANAIAETSEGFIWIGSYGGLVRYDGNTFERMDSTTGLGSVVSLYVDSSDRLWIGTNESGIALMKQDKFKFWGEDAGLKGAKVCSIAEDDRGYIYVATTAELAMISPEMKLEVIDDPRIAGRYIEHVQHGNDGLMYATTIEDDFFTLRDGKVENYIGHDEAKIKNITDVLPDPDNPGMMYVGGDNSRIYYTDTNLVPDEEKTVDVSPLASVLDLTEIDNKIWVCARNGIGLIDDEGFHDLSSELPLNNSVDFVMSDYEGGLWFASSRQGVMKVVNNRFSDVFKRYDIGEEVVNSTCLLDGKLFIACDTGLIVVDDKERLAELPIKSAVTAGGVDLGAGDLIQMLDGVRLRSIIRDSKNRLWISTWRGPGLLCYSDGQVTAYTEDDGILSSHIRAVCEADDGSIIVASTGGVSVIQDGSIIKSYTAEDGIENPEVLTVAAAPNGDILVGSNGGGIYVIDEDGTRCISKKNGLTSGIVMRIKYDRRRNLFWMVTSNSIAYMTEDYKVTPVTNFPYSNNFDLYENSKGDMWVLSSNGIYLVPVEELIRNEDIRPVYYSMANGLPSITTSNSYSELTDEGDLYIAGGSGVAKVNIEEPLEEISILKQAVPFIRGDGEYYYPDENGTFTIPFSTQRLTIYGYVYNYALTDPKVTYRLIGFDRRPTTVNRSDLRPVTYTNLAGGMYRFTMQISDAMGRGSNKLDVKIVKEKAIYEQTWFYIAAAGLISLIIYGIVRFFVNRKERAMEVKHRADAERARISHELTMASRIQTGMLPHTFPPFPGRSEFDIYAVMEPAREVGGDFYDFFLIDEDHLCLVIADVSGKGIPAALFMMVSKVILQTYASMDQSAAEILSKTNEVICQNNQNEMFITVWLGILEISTGKLNAANAGHEYPVLKKAGGQYELVRDQHSLVVGGIEGTIYKDYEMDLSPGDKLFLYTDGVPEATDAGDNMMGTTRMIDVLNENTDASPTELLISVRAAVNEFVKDAEQFDDLTMLCIEYRG